MPNARGKGSNGGGGGGGKSGGKGSSGGGLGGGGDRWSCRVCGLGDNFAWRSRCRGCEAYRKRGEGGPLSVSPDPHLPQSGRQPPQSSRMSQGTNGGGATLAERQLQRQREELRAQKRKSEDEVRRLREENSRLAAAADAARNASGSAGREGVDGGEDQECGDEDMDCAEAYASWTEEERKEQLEVSRGGLAYAIKRHGETSEEADAVRAEIEALQRASRDAKPFRAHRSQLERRRDKLRRQQERDGEEIASLQAAIAEQQTKLDELRSAVADRSKALASVDDELTELVKKALAEEGKVDEDFPTWSADAATNVIRSMAAKPGIPREVAALLEQVQLAVAAMAAAAAPADGGQAQQQLPHQHQQKHQGSELGASADREGTTTGGKGPTPAAGLAGAAPTFLGPQGRWAKGPMAAGTATGTAAAANHGGASGGPTDATGTSDATTTATTTATLATSTAAAAAAAGAPAAPTPRVHAAEESEEELVEGSTDNDVQMDGDVETSINKLPKEDQAKLRRALKSRGGIRRGNRGADDDEGRGRDRERSPRPAAKKGGNEDAGQGDM